MNISASELVKRSASQLLYKEIKKLQWSVTPGQLIGNTYAEKVIKKENGVAEKRGVIDLQQGNLLFFCIDMVKENKFIEIKMVMDENNYEEWYLKSSIMQSTFYSTLLDKVSTLNTPTFRLKEGYKQETLVVPKHKEFQLWFGKQRFKIFSNEEIFKFYVSKAEIIYSSIDNKDFDRCREFDAKYKFKEFDIFSPKYELI